MLIAIDIGNTRIKAGLFENDKLVSINSFSDGDELIKYLNSSECNNIAISSVVPEKTELVKKNFEQKNIFEITHKVKTNLTLAYKTPETLGTDRLCSAEGAFKLFRQSEAFKNYNEKVFILSVDFGTATTINIIEYPGSFIGGLIAPGIGMMFSSLNKNTAQLPLLDISDYKSLIGSDTKTSIASGVVNSAVGLIEKVRRYLIEEKTASEIHTYITGGNAEKIIPYLNFNFIFEEGLIFYGVYSLWKLNIEISLHQ